MVFGGENEPDGVDCVLGGLNNGIASIHQATEQHIALFDQIEITSLVDLNNVIVIHTGNVVVILTHNLLQLVVTLLGTLALDLVRGNHLAGKTLIECKGDENENDDGQKRANQSRKEQRSLGMMKQPQYQSALQIVHIHHESRDRPSQLRGSKSRHLPKILPN